ncbi:MAG: hypothetical protein KJ063_09725 [Anaerolineae bacterium]|nr:hypothetical protein [Anaerolineae bacterium]
MSTSPPYLTALLTLTIPGENAPTQVTIKLWPADKIETAAGQKRLGDCTLAELAAYADQLEAAVTADYAHIRLAEWTEQTEQSLVIALLNEGENSTPVTAEDGLAYLVVVGESTDAAAPQPEKAAPPADETTPAADTPTEAKPDAAAPSDEPTIHVAEAEPVFAEREASSVETPAAAAPSGKPKIRIAGLRRPLNHPTWAATDILINETAFRDAQAHALSSLEREVAGVLIGPPPEKQPDGRYVVHITDTIIAKHTRMHGASVTYTPESWRYLNDKLAEMYPDESGVMVGWYHTHPGFGIFLSGMDQFIHQNFFTQVWHVALVLDPVARTSGFFCWDRGKTRVDRYDFPWPYWAHKGW